MWADVLTSRTELGTWYMPFFHTCRSGSSILLRVPCSAGVRLV